MNLSKSASSRSIHCARDRPEIGDKRPSIAGPALAGNSDIMASWIQIDNLQNKKELYDTDQL